MLKKYRLVAIANSLLMLCLIVMEILCIQLELDEVAKYILAFSLVLPGIAINFYTCYLLITERKESKNGNKQTQS